MRSFLLIAAAALSFSATMTFETTEANAVVCARGVVRAGCAGARGAVVVRKPAVVCRTVVVNGVSGSPLHLSPRRFIESRSSRSCRRADNRSRTEPARLKQGHGVRSWTRVGTEPRSLIIFL